VEDGLVDQTAIAEQLRASGSVFAEDEAGLLVASAATPGDLDRMVEQRLAGVPVEHVVGWVEFCGRRFDVAPGVFVPRRRTELLVRRATALAHPSAVVVDVCCGCGAVGASVAAAVGGVDLHAVDVDAAAVACARRNLSAVGGQAYVGDMYDPLPARLLGRVDVVVANVPYVPSSELDAMPPEARLHEPATALDGGADGLDLVRRLSAGAWRWLAPGGHLLVETSQRQAVEAAAVLGRAGLETWVARSIDLDATVVVGGKPAFVPPVC
jgi:release factor glutamine methyltransferase